MFVSYVGIGLMKMNTLVDQYQIHQGDFTVHIVFFEEAIMKEDVLRVILGIHHHESLLALQAKLTQSDLE